MDAFHQQNLRDRKRRLRIRPGWALTVLAAMMAYWSSAQDLVWAHQYGSSGQDQTAKVVTDASGNSFVTGYFTGTIDVDPGPGVTNLSSATTALFISKLAADGTLIWAEKLTSTGSIQPQGLAVDGSGNIYVCGSFNGTVDFDPGPATANLSWHNNSAFVAKYDASFGYQWANEFHSGGGVSAQAGVAIDGSGNVFVAGHFSETISTINITNLGTFTSDTYIAKFNASGTYQWGRGYHSFGDSRPNGIGLTSTDDLVVVGSFSTTMDGNPGSGVANITSAGASDVYIGKLTNSGNFISINKFGGSAGYDVPSGMLVDANDNVLLMGTFTGTVDLDPGAGIQNKTAVGPSDGYLVKLDPNFNLVWASQISGATTEFLLALDQNASGEILLAGAFNNTIDFDPGAGSNIQTTQGNYDMFGLKLDANGSYLEGVTVGSTANDFAFAGAFDGNDNMLVGGRFEGTMDVDPGVGVNNLVTVGSFDAFLASYGQAAPADTTDPTIACQSATIYVDANGDATLDSAAVVASVSDNSGSVNVSLAQTAFTCADVGSTGPDQSQTLDFLPIGGFLGIAQSFQAGQSGELTALDIKGYHSSGTVNMTVEIRTGTNPVGGTVIATEGFVFTGTSPAPVTINFTNPPVVTAGSDYVFVLLDGANPGLPILGTGVGNPYANGTVIQNIPPNWNPNANIDAFFNTYVSSAAAVAVTATDGAGNTATCDANVTVLDTLAPTVTCLNDTVILDAFGQASVTAADLVGSAADNCSVADTTLSASTFTTNEVGNNAITVTVEDASGNTATCIANVFVIEPAPTAICQNVTVYLDANGQASITANDVDNGSNSLVGIASTTVSQSNFSCADLGTNNVTLTVTSNLGGVDSCVALVTVEDTTTPSLTCPATINVNNDAGSCDAVVTFAATSSDNCTETLTYSHVSGSVFPIGTTTVTVTAADASGNSTTCSFDVVVTDNETPAIACPANINVNTDAATCGATVTYTAPVGTDNCSGSTTTQIAGLASGSLFPVGTTTNTFEVIDASGNATTCSFDVVVTDNEAPAIACPANINVNTDAATCGATVTYATPVGTDNCSGATTTQIAGLASGSLFPVGTTTNTFEVVDASGNATTCSFDVVVTDNEAPAIACPANISVNTDAATCGATVTYAAPVGTDNCSGSTTTQIAGLASGSLFPVGTTTNTFEVVDASGNATTCSFDVVVTDNEAPAIACPANINANTDAATCGATVTYAAPVGTDNCSGATTTQIAGLASGSLFPVGTTTNTFEVVDASGNATTCSFDVVVTDNEAPAIACPANINANTDAATCGATVTYSTPVGTDNCSGATTTQIAGLASGSLFPVGTTTNTFEVVDASGNATTCSFDVTVTDNEAPAIVCPANMNVNTDAATCGATVTYATPVGTDNCSGSTTTQIAGLASGSLFPVGTTTNTFEVIDAAGNVTTCSFDVVVTDNEAPAIACPANINVNTDAATCGATVTYATPVGTDNCSGSSTTQIAGLASGSLFPVGTTTNTFEVIDAAGNATTCSFDVTVTDNEAPTAMCKDLTVQLDINGNASITASQIDNGSSDACGVASTSLDITSFACDDLGANTVVLTVTDVHGNVSTCTATVTVEESYYVDLNCVSDINAACDFNQGGAIVNWNVPTAVTYSSCDSGCSPNTAIPGFIYMGELNGSRYYCSSTSNYTWQQADAEAQAAGGHLAVINSSAENSFLANQLIATYAWIGLTDEFVEGQYQWVNNDPLTYTKWKNNEPNNAGGWNCSGAADYTVMRKNNGKWYDRKGCSKYEFIMEVPCSNPTTITQIAGPASGSLFTTGVHTITYAATDNVTGATDTCSFTVTVDTCNPVYCSSQGLNTNYEWIDEVELVNEFTNYSGNDNGYADYTNIVAHVNTGQNMTLNLTPGFSGNSYFERWKVWVDWNRDGDFWDAGEKVYSGSGFGMKTGSFTVPSNAAVGELRMRVAMRWGAWPWACGSFWYGEVEDYTIVVDDAAPGYAKTAGNDVNIEPVEEATASGFEFRMLYPNPATANSELNLEIRSGQAEEIDLQLTNVMGQLMQTQSVSLQEGMNRITFQTKNVSAGVYLIRVNGHQESIRLIVR